MHTPKWIQTILLHVFSDFAYDILKSVGGGIVIAIFTWILFKLRSEVDWVIVSIMFLVGMVMIFLSQIVPIRSSRKNIVTAEQQVPTEDFSIQQMQQKISISLIESPQLYITPPRLFTAEASKERPYEIIAIIGNLITGSSIDNLPDNAIYKRVQVHRKKET